MWAVIIKAVMYNFFPLMWITMKSGHTTNQYAVAVNIEQKNSRCTVNARQTRLIQKHSTWWRCFFDCRFAASFCCDFMNTGYPSWEGDRPDNTAQGEKMHIAARNLHFQDRSCDSVCFDVRRYCTCRRKWGYLHMYAFVACVCVYISCSSVSAAVPSWSRIY